MNVIPTKVPPQYLRSRMGKVCVAIIGDTAAEMVEKAESAVRDNPFVEFRLDYLEKPLAALPRLKEFLSEHSEVTAIATCRRKTHGGRFSGNLAAELEVLQKAAQSGFHIVDLELQSAEAMKKAEMEKLQEQVALIISYHDFEATRDLDKIYERMVPFAPDFYKIVTTAKSLSDNVTMIRFLERTRDAASVIGVCMGDYGIISRVLGVRAGSLFTFAAASVGEETAPGQIAARTLHETYRIDQVDAATRVYGVAGNPVRHSLSPIMLNTAFRRETVNAVYLALQTNKLSDLLNLVNEIPIHGFSVTMPFKVDILKHLDRTDAMTEKIGACNTVVRAQDGKLIGFNTDVAGIVRPLETRLELRKAKVLVLGVGGTGRAAVYGLLERGADVYVLNRTPQKAQGLARSSGAKTIRRELLAKTQFDVIINTTPVGMTGQKQQSWLEPEELNAKYVFDAVYSPLDTPLLQMARARGIQTITGLEMFVNQGAEQFQLWTGKPAPKEEMYRVALHALKQRAEAVGQGAPRATPLKAIVAKVGAVSEKVPAKATKKAAKVVRK
ncbi:MAG TPA: shikimate dehydrogenase [Acidobacteriaceae bacterium]|nr:shikimate dehydrogenase [Acidobacteriaceae bacterium]